MTFAPAPFIDGRRALMTAGGLLLAGILFGLLILVLPVSAFSFLLLIILLSLLALAIYIAWRAWLCLTLAYWVDRNAITIAWGPLRQVVPLGQIKQIVRGGPTPVPGEARWPWLRRLPWLERWLIFGPELEMARRADGHFILSLASQPLPEQLLLETAAGSFGISPADPARFLTSLEQHHRLGPTRLLPMERRRPAIAQSPLWQDRLSLLLLLAGFEGALLTLGVLMARYPGLPDTLASLQGASRDVLFWVPAFAFAVWIINGLWGLTVYERQRVAANLLWGGTLVVQATTLIAMLSIKG